MVMRRMAWTRIHKAVRWCRAPDFSSTPPAQKYFRRAIEAMGDKRRHRIADFDAWLQTQNASRGSPPALTLPRRLRLEASTELRVHRFRSPASSELWQAKHLCELTKERVSPGQIVRDRSARLAGNFDRRLTGI